MIKNKSTGIISSSHYTINKIQLDNDRKIEYDMKTSQQINYIKNYDFDIKSTEVANNDLYKIKHIKYDFDRYEIDVVVDSNDKFIGISGIKLAKVFYASDQLPGWKDINAEKLLEEFTEEDNE